MYVLPFSLVQEYRNFLDDVEESLEMAEVVVKEGGVPSCDFQHYRKLKKNRMSPLDVFRQVVNRLIGMQRFERRKNSRFADVLREIKEQEEKRKVKDRRTLDMEELSTIVF